MLEWLAAHAATIIISAVLIVLLALAIRYIVKKRRSGGCVGCDACASKGGCTACHGCASNTAAHACCSHSEERNKTE